MPRKSKDQKDRTSIIISIVVHAVLIAGVAYWAYKTGRLEQLGRKVLEFVKQEKKEEKKEEQKPIQQKATPPKLPPINTGAPQQSSGGTRRAVASEAPAAAGETFFEDTRKQVSGPGGGAGPKEEKTKGPILLMKPPPRVDLRPPVSTAKGSTAKLLAERQSAKSVSDSIGSEAIERGTSSDVGDVVTKVTGTTIVDGKFAVVRGLSDRYTATTLNGGEIPTPDPYRRQVQLDIFPAKVVQSVNVTKTFTPDLPGSFVGGLIDIRTKSFPEQFNFSSSAGVSYNTQANLNDKFITDEGGSYDPVALGAKTRALPGILKNASPAPPPPRPPRNESQASADQRRSQADTLAAMTRSFSTTVMGPIEEKSGMNWNFNMALGDTVRMFERPLGYFVGFDYRNVYSFYDDGVQSRFNADLSPDKDLTETRGIHEVSWTAVVSLAYQLNPDNQIDFTFLFNQSADDVARAAQGQDFSTGSPDQTLHQLVLDYVERNLTTYQLRGQHLFPEINDLKVEWLGALSTTYQDEPDERFFNYWTYPTESGGTANRFDNALPQPQRPTRFFRTVNEDNKNVKLDVTQPFRQWALLESSVKMGGYYNQATRQFDERTFTYQSQNNDVPWLNGGVPNNYITPSVLGYQTQYIPSRGTNFVFSRYINSELGNSTYDGELKVPAAYGMMDLPLRDDVHLIGGARVEKTDLTITTVTPLIPQGTNTVIDQTDVLPSVGFLWNIGSNMNLRLNYSQTIARPAFRELAPVRVYDIVNDIIYVGNPDLKIVDSQNYDARWEWFPRPGEVVSVGAFFKQLKNPIEQYALTLENSVITFTNRDKAIVLGVELEGRTALDILDANLANFSVGGNFSVIYSRVQLTDTELFNKRQYDPSTPDSRPLYDQSPYIVNVDLTYSNPSSGTTATLSANLAGERIYFTSAAGPDVYDHPPVLLDFVISQQLSRHWKAKFTARNLLNSPVLRTYGDGDSPIYTRYTRGLTFGLSLSCDY
jgi:TonB-dependent receptor